MKKHTSPFSQSAITRTTGTGLNRPLTIPIPRFDCSDMDDRQGHVGHVKFPTEMNGVVHMVCTSLADDSTQWYSFICMHCKRSTGQMVSKDAYPRIEGTIALRKHLQEVHNEV